MSPSCGTRPTLVAAIAVLGAVVAGGCTQQVVGQPTDAVGFSPRPTTTVTATPTTRQGLETTSVPESLRLDDVDLCELVTPGDLEPLGGVTGAASRDSVLPDSCSYQLAGGAPDDLAVVARYKPIEQVRDQQPDGHAERAAGYPAWITCETDSGYNSCTAAVAVRPDRTLLTGLSQRDTPTGTVISRLERLTVAAIDRLPAAD